MGGWTAALRRGRSLCPEGWLLRITTRPRIAEANLFSEDLISAVATLPGQTRDVAPLTHTPGRPPRHHSSAVRLLAPVAATRGLMTWMSGPQRDGNQRFQRDLGSTSVPARVPAAQIDQPAAGALRKELRRDRVNVSARTIAD